MSQSSLRRPRKGEEVYVELQDDGGSNIQWAVGPSERQASDEAERRWARSFSTPPTRKSVRVRKVYTA